MDKYLAMIPKNVLAFLAIVGGIAFIIWSQPPHTVCDSQIEVIRQAQGRFLFQDPKSKMVPTTRYEILRDQCRGTNSPGGCYELFQELKNYLHDLNSLTQECSAMVSGTKEYRRALWEPAEIIVRLAWGEAPPASYAAKMGWLDTADISLFCQLKDRITVFFGASEWDQFRERVMQELPGAKDLARNQIWDLSIFSENCARYP